MSVPSGGRGVGRSKGGIMADSGIYIGNDIWIFSFGAAMVDGTSGTGAGVTGPGSICANSSTGVAYINTNTKASPTWTVIGAQT